MPKCWMTVLFILTIFLLRGNVAHECEEDQYQTGGACRECKSTCAKCISDFLCTECKAGFFGDACTKTCSAGCREELCVQETGDCVDCDVGYYLNNKCKPCPENCTECQNADKCTKCKPGYTGTICQKHCFNCKPGSVCSLVEGICNDGCKDGYSGRTCLESCGSNCLSCDRFDAKKCTSCVKGTYGINCEKLCSTKCKDTSCKKDTGTCIHGCRNGFWGDQCEYECPVNCRNGTCLKISGICSDGCRGNFMGTKCLCPSTCDCDADGTCIKCSDNSGFVCGKQCSSMCENNICSSDTETKCFYGCKDGYDGSLCSPLLTDSETDDGKSYITIIVIFVVVAGILVSVACVTVFIKRRQARLSGRTQLSTTQSCAEDCSIDGSEMCNLRCAVLSDEVELPSNIGKQHKDQYEEEKGHEYASLLETCHEPSKTGALVQEPGPRDHTLSGQRRPESPKAKSQRAEGSSELTEEPFNKKTDSKEASLEENFGVRLTVDVDPGKETTQQSTGILPQKNKYQVSLSTKVPLRELENLTEDDIRNEFKRLSASTESKEVDETYPYELLKSSTLPKEYQDSLNACYIDAYKKTEAYIACSWPVGDKKTWFWSMVWNERCDRIVMLSDNVGQEGEQYWPNLGDSFKCGDITVKCLSLDDFEDDFIQRELVIKKETEERIVLQQHFVAWPEDLVPRSVNSFAEFQKYRDSSTSEKVVPIVVHCSDGIGRTGTYIAFDSLVQEGRATGSVDVSSCVQRLQEQKSIKQELGKQRKTIVQTYEQYAFIYKALLCWVKQDKQKSTTCPVVPRKTVDSSYEPVEPKSDNPYEMFKLLHALDINTK